MPRYKQETIEEVRLRNDVVDVVGSVVKLKRSGSNYFGLCPFHSEKSASFCVNPARQSYHCFGCGKGGNVIGFVMEYENYSFPEAVKYLADRVGVNLPEVEETEDEKKAASLKAKVLDCLKAAAVYYYKRLYQPEGKHGLDYLHGRGLTDETIKSFGLGYSGKGYDQAVSYLREKGYADQVIQEAGLCNMSEKHGMTDRFFNRVMFPIMDVNNKVIGFGGRVMGDGQPKYLNSPETVVFDKSRNMYGLNVARKSRKPYRIVCEGYMDVISMHQAGFTEAVASLGTAFTSGHANMLRRYTKDVRLTYDSDEAGQKAAMRAIPICRSAGITTRIIHMEPYKDPDEFIKGLGASEFQDRIDKAENSFFFELGYMEKGFDMSDPEGRTGFQSQMARKLAEIEDELARDNYISSAASKYSIKEDALRRAVAIAQEKLDAEPQRSLDGLSPRDNPGIRRSLAGQAYGGARSDPHGNAVGRNADANGNGGSRDGAKSQGIESAESYLLTWMADDEAIYDAVKPYLEATDFTEGVTREMAEAIYKGYGNGKMSIADIMTEFAAKDQSQEASLLINRQLDSISSSDERARALTDLVIKIKKAALQRAKEVDDGVDPLKKTKEERAALDKLKKIKITI